MEKNMGRLTTFYQTMGWCKRILYIKDFNNLRKITACCLHGALEQVSSEYDRIYLSNKLQSAIKQEIGRAVGIAQFNDYYLGSKEQLMAFLEKYEL